MRYIVAVSGGVDSVVLLHQVVTAGEHDVIVAHFDHGIRTDSAADARFVAGLAAHYGVPFVARREELGAQASEDRARTRRYEFLRTMARQHGADIMTAHHRDDVLETIAINCLRGTGWRGLAVLSNPTVVRPLLAMTKQQIYDYARAHRLEWVEDSTNQGDDYLRNRLRRRALPYVSAPTKDAVVVLWRAQCQLREEIDAEMTTLRRSGAVFSRYFMTQIDATVAEELLRGCIAAAQGRPPTRPQAARALLAIKTGRAGTVHYIGSGARLRLSTRSFIVEKVIL